MNLYDVILAVKAFVKKGSKVVANPTLAGSENALTGLEVDGTKYTVGGGNLYQHNLFFRRYGMYIATTIINDSSSALTPTDLRNYLYSNGFTSSVKFHLAEVYKSGSTSKFLGLYCSSATGQIYATLDSDGNIGSTALDYPDGFTSNEDVIVEL